MSCIFWILWLSRCKIGMGEQIHYYQSGTLHFNATYGWSNKIVTFCTLQQLYTLPQKKRNFSAVAFLLGRSVRQ